MPAGRPKVDLDTYRHELTSLYNEDLNIDQLVQYLYDEYNITVTSRTIKRRFKDWAVRKRTATIVSDELKKRIQVLFFEVGLDDKEMLRVLQEEGFQIGKWALIRLRFELNLKRSIRTEEQQVQADEVVRKLVSDELQKGVIDGYGRTYLYTYFRQQGHIIARHRLFRIYRTINPEAVERRKRDLQRHRGEYLVPGPNFIWSIDGYDKLKPYGIEIYACIDTYSRYIVWIYVGISNATALSCLRQFLDCLECLQYQPRFVRSDRGGETIMLANAHFQLQQDAEPGLQFEDCYLYGTSTANQRIEAWWQQLSKGYLFRWRNFFRSLQTQGFFDRNNLADSIAIFALYLPVIRKELYEFVRLWNAHTIRPQRKRPNIITGKPYMLYHHPGPEIQNWSLPLGKDSIRTMKEQIPEWDIDAFLPSQTFEWCQDFLQSLGFNSSSVQLLDESCTTPLLSFYLQLRTALREHISSHTSPQLSLLPHPVGVSHWQQNNREQFVRSADLETDYLDPLLPSKE